MLNINTLTEEIFECINILIFVILLVNYYLIQNNIIGLVLYLI